MVATLISWPQLLTLMKITTSLVQKVLVLPTCISVCLHVVCEIHEAFFQCTTHYLQQVLSSAPCTFALYSYSEQSARHHCWCCGGIHCHLPYIHLGAHPHLLLLHPRLPLLQLSGEEGSVPSHSVVEVPDWLIYVWLVIAINHDDLLPVTCLT